MVASEFCSVAVILEFCTLVLVLEFCINYAMVNINSDSNLSNCATHNKCGISLKRQVVFNLEELSNGIIETIMPSCSLHGQRVLWRSL